MRQLILTTLLVLSTALAFAQPGRGQDKNVFSELNLTEQQQTTIAAIRKDSRDQMQALRQGGERPDRATMQKLRQDTRAKMEAVLTPEQRTQLAAQRAERKQQRKNVDREALRADLQAHRAEEVEPVLRAARGRLNELITAEDKVAIERLRGVYATRPARKAAGGRAAGDDSARQAQREEAKQWREAHADDIAELQALTEKYRTEIDRVQERLQPNAEQWKAERRAIAEEHVGDKKRKGQRNNKGAKGENKGWQKAGAFLLLKP